MASGRRYITEQEGGGGVINKFCGFASPALWPAFVPMAPRIARRQRSVQGSVRNRDSRVTERPLENDEEFKAISVGSLSCMPRGQCRNEATSRSIHFFVPAANGISTIH